MLVPVVVAKLPEKNERHRPHHSSSVVVRPGVIAPHKPAKGGSSYRLRVGRKGRKRGGGVSVVDAVAHLSPTSSSRDWPDFWAFSRARFNAFARQL